MDTSQCGDGGMLVSVIVDLFRELAVSRSGTAVVTTGWMVVVVVVVVVVE